MVGPSELFVPMGRVEKMLLDRPCGHLPSLAERFERRVGRSVQEIIALGLILTGIAIANLRKRKAT